MKKNIYNIPTLFFALWMMLNATSCNDDAYNGIDNTGGVKILTFTTAGSKLDKLDEANSYIEMILPTVADLTKLAPSFTLSDGARVADGIPGSPNGPIDLNNPVIYRIINGNLYHEYKVMAKHVADVTYFEEMNIGIYKGKIDNNARTILVKLPIGSDITALTPTYKLSEGAKLISPTSTVQDFTNPVKYTIGYLDESFTYTVEVQVVNFTPVAFLGTPATSGDITNMDDKTAYQWLTDNFPEQEYISFADIKAGKELSRYGVIWYHYDAYDKGGDPTVPSAANDPKVIAALNEYLNQGGGLLLSSAGMALGQILDIAKDGKMWNNAWGYDNAPFKVEDGNGIGWGVRVKDPQHPAFKNVQWNTGETHRFFLISNGCYAKGHNIRWNFFADWDGNAYNGDVARWEATNGGIQLASLHWDDSMNQVSIITEYPGTNGKGTVITIGAECYDWYQENNSPANKFKKNLETLTDNILNYLAE